MVKLLNKIKNKNIKIINLQITFCKNMLKN